MTSNDRTRAGRPASDARITPDFLAARRRLGPHRGRAARASSARPASRIACRRSCATPARAGSRPSTACCRARPPRARSARRPPGKVGGRTQEIQRLIGRSLRSVTNLPALGERTIWIDCDVIQADGGTRTASITGAFVALVLALREAARARHASSTIPLTDYVAATSVGIVDGDAAARPRLRGRLARRGRHEHRQDRRRPVHRGAGHRRGPAVRAPRARRAARPRRQRASASSSSCSARSSATSAHDAPRDAAASSPRPTRASSARSPASCTACRSSSLTLRDVPADRRARGNRRDLRRERAAEGALLRGSDRAAERRRRLRARDRRARRRAGRPLGALGRRPTTP